MGTPKGYIRRRGGSYEISVPVGRDPVTQRYRYAYDHAGSQEEAERKRDAMIERIAEGREPLNKATVNELLDRWLSVAELELSTRVSYEGYVDRVIRPVLGKMRLRELEIRVDILDVLYAELRRCRKLCGGKKDLVDHRPLGRARRSGEDGPGHECDERCRPHVCKPLEPTSIRQIHSILRRAFNFAVKWRWVSENPVRLATVPRSHGEVVDPPTPEEATLVLEAAEAQSADLAVFVWLVMVTGARRGEMCALRWTDIDVAEQDLLIARAYSVHRGIKTVKDTKTHQKRRLAVDAGTLELLAEHQERCAQAR
jgi:integrase